jgi:hypothetical protein
MVTDQSLRPDQYSRRGPTNIQPALALICAPNTFQVDEVRPGQSDQDVTVSIYGELNANPAAPTAGQSDLSARTPTGEICTTINLDAIVSEIDVLFVLLQY